MTGAELIARIKDEDVSMDDVVPEITAFFKAGTDAELAKFLVEIRVEIDAIKYADRLEQVAPAFNDNGEMADHMIRAFNHAVKYKML